MKDVEKAYALAKTKPSPSVTSVLGALVVDDQFPPEQLLPQSLEPPEPVSEKPMWQHETVEELLADVRMVEAIKVFAAEQASVFVSAAADFDETKKRLFLQHIVEPFRNDPIAMLRTVLAWTPNTGGGAFGHNTDDNALDYVEAARKQGGLGSLTLDQRRRLIGDLLEGATVGDDEDAVMSVLTSAPDSEARALISHFGWERLHDDIDDFFGEVFAERFPKSRYGP